MGEKSREESPHLQSRFSVSSVSSEASVQAVASSAALSAAIGAMENDFGGANVPVLMPMKDGAAPAPNPDVPSTASNATPWWLQSDSSRQVTRSSRPRC